MNIRELMKKEKSRRQALRQENELKKKRDSNEVQSQSSREIKNSNSDCIRKKAKMSYDEINDSLPDDFFDMGVSHEDVSHEDVSHEGVSHEGASLEGVSHEDASHENASVKNIKLESDPDWICSVWGDSIPTIVEEYSIDEDHAEVEEDGNENNNNGNYSNSFYTLDDETQNNSNLINQSQTKSQHCNITHPKINDAYSLILQTNELNSTSKHENSYVDIPEDFFDLEYTENDSAEKQKILEKKRKKCTDEYDQFSREIEVIENQLATENQKHELKQYQMESCFSDGILKSIQNTISEVSSIKKNIQNTDNRYHLPNMITLEESDLESSSESDSNIDNNEIDRTNDIDLDCFDDRVWRCKKFTS